MEASLSTPLSDGETRPTEGEISSDAPSGGVQLTVNNIRKRFGDIDALAGLSFNVGSGSILGLVGPNGAGKTTAIRCITGLLKPDEGRVEISDSSGRPFTDVMALASQDIGLYPGLTARDNLEFFGRLDGRSPLVERLDQVSGELDLTPILESTVGNLSTGQQRLVHVAASLITRPALLILDEPTAALDVGSRSAVLDAVRARRAAGTTIVFSSHYLDEIQEVCDHVVMLEEGTVLASGSVEELIEAHGGARVEVTVDGELHRYEGADVTAAIDQAQVLGPIESLEVIPPSLKAAFLSLTGRSGAEIER